MLIKIYDEVVINASAIVSIIPRYTSENAKYAEAEYSGWWLWKKEIKPRREIKAKVENWHLKLTYVDAVHKKETWLEWTDQSIQDRDIRAKHISSIVMNLDDDFITKAFEREVLK